MEGEGATEEAMEEVVMVGVTEEAMEEVVMVGDTEVAMGEVVIVEATGEAMGEVVLVEATEEAMGQVVLVGATEEVVMVGATEWILGITKVATVVEVMEGVIRSDLLAKDAWRNGLKVTIEGDPRKEVIMIDDRFLTMMIGIPIDVQVKMVTNLII